MNPQPCWMLTCDHLLTAQETLLDSSRPGEGTLSSANTTLPTTTSQQERLRYALLFLHSVYDFLFHLAVEGLTLLHPQMFAPVPTLSRLQGGWRSLSNTSNKTLICHQPKILIFSQPLIRTLSKGLIKPLNWISSGSVTHAPVFKAKCPFNKVTLLKFGGRSVQVPLANLVRKWRLQKNGLMFLF